MGCLQDGKISEKEHENMIKLLEESTLSDEEKESLKDIFTNWKEKDK